jgi:hypothetical protein
MAAPSSGGGRSWIVRAAEAVSRTLGTPCGPLPQLRPKVVEPDVVCGIIGEAPHQRSEAVRIGQHVERLLQRRVLIRRNEHCRWPASPSDHDVLATVSDGGEQLGQPFARLADWYVLGHAPSFPHVRKKVHLSAAPVAALDSVRHPNG